jgi:hypothetical protein
MAVTKRSCAVCLDAMRKQYFFRPSPRGFSAWDVGKLIELTAAYPRRRVALSEICDLNEPWFGTGEAASWVAFTDRVGKDVRVGLDRGGG